jgi:hypothetical protein
MAAGGEGRVIEPVEVGGGSNTAAGEGSALDIQATAKPGGGGARPSRGGGGESAPGRQASGTGQKGPAGSRPGSAGGRGSVGETVQPQAPGKQARAGGGTNEPGGQGTQPKTGSPGARPKPRLVSPDVPEYPQFPESVEKYGHDKALDFFNANKSKYPKPIRQAIDRARPGVKTDVDNIDQLIRRAQTVRANEALNFPARSEPVTVGVDASGRPIRQPSSPFTTTTKGHTPLVEGTGFERGFTVDARGNPKNLTYEGVTHDGERVQIDDFDFQKRIGKEVKMPLALHNDPKYFARNIEGVVDQMRRQAKFTSDWKFNRYEWQMFSPQDVATAERALALLAEQSPELAKKIVITTFY